MSTTTEEDRITDAARAVEGLRLAEAKLSRRRQSDCGPSENARAAMRFILEGADDGGGVTPTAIAHHLRVSTASVTGMLDRLHQGGLIAFTSNPGDRRSKLVVPFDRDADLDDIDPLTAHIRSLADELTPDAAAQVAHFLTRVREAVDRECA